MRINYRIFLLGLLVLTFFSGYGQKEFYKVHAHNDYVNPYPFYGAYVSGAASIEVDVFLKDRTLYVTHSEAEIKAGRTLESLYLKPMQHWVDAGKPIDVQLLIDIKSGAESTLKALEKTLRDYPQLIDGKVRFVISGNRPAPERYGNYPDFIQFDLQDLSDLETANLDKVAMISRNFRDYSVWNGLGRMTAGDLEHVKKVIEQAHAAGKPFRFWGAPDTKTAWSRFARLGVDFINTDKPWEAVPYLEKLDNNTYTNQVPQEVYIPTYDFDYESKPARVILMIGDGNGLSQICAAQIANRGSLTLTELKDVGLIKTSSQDDLVTDSAAGATAMATGTKTNNRAIGVDARGNELLPLPEILKKNGFFTGIFSTDAITGATPSAFFAHTPERDDADVIVEDLRTAPIDFFAAGGKRYAQQLADKFTIQSSLETLDTRTRTAVFLADGKVPAMGEGRGQQFPEMVKQFLTEAEKQDAPLFLMIEGAQIDSNGHTNNVAGIVKETLDFDRTLAEVLRFADVTGNTLVIVTADHETSGFAIAGGDLKTGEVQGDFTTHDHTGVMVPVFAYGPQAHRFRGVYENTAIFSKILEAIQLQETGR